MKIFLILIFLVTNLWGNNHSKIPEFALKYLDKYCLNCHDKDTEKGDIHLEFDSVNWGSHEDRELWASTLMVSHDKMMPPIDKKQPSDKERKQFTSWIQSSLDESPIFSSTKARRLSKEEYINSIRSLFKMKNFQLPIGFPEDNKVDGFDNLSEGLVLSTDLLEAYSEVAEQVASRIFPRQMKYDTTVKDQKISIKDFGRSYQATSIHDNKLRLISTTEMYKFSGTWLDKVEIKVPGIYKISVTASSFKADRFNFLKEPMIMEVRAADTTASERARYKRLRLLKEIKVDSNTPETYTFEAQLFAGQTVIFRWKNAPIDFEPDPLKKHLEERFKKDKTFHSAWNKVFGPMIRKRRLTLKSGNGWEVFEKVLNDPNLDTSNKARNQKVTSGIFKLFYREKGKEHLLPPSSRFYNIFANEYFQNGPALELHKARVTGPLSLIPGKDEINAQLRQKNILGLDLSSKANKEEIVKEFLVSFLPKAFRRPVSKQSVEAYMKMARKAWSEGHDLKESLHLIIRNILISPRFLYRSYNEKLDDYDLASRLSYFLTKNPPDEQLLDLASKKMLRDPVILRQEALRLMPQHYKSPMIQSFVGQWLHIDNLKNIMPAPKFKYSDVDTEIAKQEVFLFFYEILSKDLPMTTFIDPDFTYSTRGFAHRVYGLGKAPSSNYQSLNNIKFARMSIPKGFRHGGLLGQSAVMLGTANGVDTQAVLRGVWVMENILGLHIPEPPQNIPALTPDINGAISPRDILSKHTSTASCVSCHKKIDPLGFVLENFDPVGKWRNKWPETNTPIDSSGVLFDGTKVKNVFEFKKWLVQNIDYFSVCLSKKLMTYGTGRLLNFSEKEEMKNIVRNTRLQNKGFKSLLLNLITSRTFMGNLYTKTKSAPTQSPQIQKQDSKISASQSKGKKAKLQPFKGHETFDNISLNRFIKFPKKNSKIQNGLLWTHGESGSKYPPQVEFPIDEKDCTISLRFRHLGEGKLLYLFIDGDDGFGGQDHMLRVKVTRNAVGIQVDNHSKNPQDPKFLKIIKKQKKQRPDKKERPPDPASGAYRIPELLRPDKVNLNDNEWHELELVFKKDSVSISIDKTLWEKKLTRPGFAFKKDEILLMLNGGKKGIEIDDLKVLSK